MSRPHRLVLSTLVVAVALLATQALAETTMTKSNSPKVVFDKMEIVYPNVHEGEMLHAQFPFSNQGKMNLIIDSVTPSCGCTVAEFDRVTQPGAKGMINLNLDTSGISGSFRKTAVVNTNDPTNPFVTLVMTGETASKVKVEKGRRLDLVGCLGQNPSISTGLTSIDGNPLIIAGVENPMQEYLTTELSHAANNRSYTLTVRSKVKEAMEFAGPIYLLVAGAPKVSIYVVADIRGAFTVQPQEVYFGGVKKGQQAEVIRSIAVNKTCVDKLKIDKLLYDPDHFKVEERWVEQNSKLLLVVSPRPENLPPGPFEEKLGIQADDKIFYVRMKGIIN
ncbi:MAG: DUF1573 domain-containing protein [Pseudomonadota bacterium]